MTSHPTIRMLFTTAIFFALAASNLAAQSVTVMGTAEEARACMSGAELAANMRVGSRTDLQACDYAIENSRLSRRDLAATYTNRGVINTAMRSYQKAFDDYNMAIDLMPKLPEPYVGRGNVYFMAERLGEAIEDYTRAMDLGLGRTHLALLNRGMAYEAQGYLQQAETDYREAVAVAPEWPLAQQKLESLISRRQPPRNRPGTTGNSPPFSEHVTEICYRSDAVHFRLPCPLTLTPIFLTLIFLTAIFLTPIFLMCNALKRNNNCLEWHARTVPESHDGLGASFLPDTD